MDIKSNVKNIPFLPHNDTQSWKSEIQQIDKQISELTETVRLLIKITSKMVKELSNKNAPTKPFNFFKILTSAGHFINENFKIISIENMKKVIAPSLGFEVIKSIVTLLWHNQKQKIIGSVLFVVAAMIGYFCLLNAAYLSLNNFVSSVVTWLILAFIHLIFAVIARKFS